MKDKVQMFSVAGLLAVALFAVVMIVQLRAQQASQVSGDFRNAQTAEIRDAQGQVLLRGTFATAESDDEQEVERKAPLTPAQAGGAGSGEAEVEHRKDAPNVQEIEFEVEGLQPRAVLTLVIDGKAVVSATANDKGAASAEVDVPVSPPGGSE